MAMARNPVFDQFPELINLAARQRMLSQRIGFFLLKLRLADEVECKVSDTDIGQLRDAIDAFENVHQLLLKGRFGEGAETITFQSLDVLLPPEMMNALNRFVAESKACVDRAEQQDASNILVKNDLFEDIPGRVLEALQEVVERLQAEFLDRSRRDADALSSSIEEAKGAINRIEAAARYSRLVSLNARVAAGRAGTYGAEFSALSTELKSVADSIQEAADDVRLYLQNVS